MKKFISKISSNIREKGESFVFEDALFLPTLRNAFPALRNRNFQLYFSGQLISLIGTWMHQVAEGWLVLQLTNSAFWVGVVAALNDVPILLFVLFGGVLVDRFSKKKILLITQFLYLCLALTLGILTLSHTITVFSICIIALIGGIISAIDMPARQAFIIEMVGKEKLTSAIALNSATWNIARIVGPAFAAFLIVLVGTGGAFIANGISFIAVIIALYCMNIQENITEIKTHFLEAIKEGITYSFTHKNIQKLLLLTAISTIFGWSYGPMIPVVVKNIFHQGPQTLSYFYSVAGLGAFIGTVLISAFHNRINPFTLILAGNIVFSISLFVFSFVNSIPLALFLLFLVGFGLIVQFSMTNSSIQQMVGNEMRGRVMSVYTLMFLGMSPLGSFQAGFVAQNFGASIAIRLGALIVFITGIVFYIYRDRITLLFTNESS